MPHGPPPTTWLTKLTLAQLRRVAFAIGAPSSGTKPVLTRQIQHELQGASASATAAAAQHKDAQKANTNGGVASTFPGSPALLSIVSIDMGIRNLAYSHLVVGGKRRPATSIGDGEKGVEQHEQRRQQSMSRRPSLLAWKRVVISGGAANGNGKSVSSSTTTTTTKKRTKAQRISEEVLATTTAPLPPAADETTTTAGADVSPPSSATAVDKEAFDPSTLANHAYTFIKNTVLAAHPPPTHVLIERQRFRSGSGSAVQEWTIRVGVFEGMLHAVLRTLAAERGLDVVVQGVDPGRVTRYWLESSERRTAVAAAQGEREGVRRYSTAKESKKAKIDIVGASLGGGSGSVGVVDALVDIGAGSDVGDSGGGGLALASSSTTTTTTTQNTTARQDAVQETVDAFIAQWKRKQTITTPKPNSRGRGKGEDPTSVTATPTTGSLKLDDLADCLLQGVAWLEWQRKRHEVLRRGLDAFAEDPMFAASFLEPKVKAKVRARVKSKSKKDDGAGTGKRKKRMKKEGGGGESVGLARLPPDDKVELKI